MMVSFGVMRIFQAIAALVCAAAVSLGPVPAGEPAELSASARQIAEVMQAAESVSEAAAPVEAAAAEAVAKTRGDAALDAAFSADALKLTEVSLSPYDLEGMLIMGVSPDAKTVLLSDTTNLYTLRDGEVTMLQPSIARSVENTYGNLSKCIEYYAKAFPGKDGVIWSPDGRYAVMPNYEVALMHMRYGLDPIVLDVVEGRFVLLDTYSPKMMEGALFSHACFSGDSRYLYAFLYGMCFEHRFALMRYDLQSGEKTMLWNGVDMVGRPGIFEMPDGSLLGLHDSSAADCKLALAMYTPTKAGYIRKTVPTTFNRRLLNGQALEYAPESGKAVICASYAGQYPIALLIGDEQEGFVGIHVPYGIESLTSTQLTALDTSKLQASDMAAAQAFAMQYVSITCARISPDGRYALLNCVKGEEDALMLLDLETKALRCVAKPQGYQGNLVATTLGQRFKPGIVWGEDGTILMITGGENVGVKAYRFE